MNSVTEIRIADFDLIETLGWTADRLIKRGKNFDTLF
jgi:hypothetical protein